MEYFHNDLPRPVLNGLNFTCGYSGLEIWYEFKQPDGHPADKRTVGFYKKVNGLSAIKYVEEYEGVSCGHKERLGAHCCSGRATASGRRRGWRSARSTCSAWRRSSPTGSSWPPTRWRRPSVRRV